MLLYLWIGLGSASGGGLGFRLSGLLAATQTGAIFPPGTRFINVTGSFIAGHAQGRVLIVKS
jgi:fluoride ion exporter CrcB/FEX